MKRLACLSPMLAGGRFSCARPSPCTSKGITEAMVRRSVSVQTADRVLLIEINCIGENKQVFYLILGQILANDIND